MNKVLNPSELIKNYREETAELIYRLDRMEHWIHEIAKQTGVKLSEI